MSEETLGSLASESSAVQEFDDRYYIASQRQLIWRRFKRHRVAFLALFLLVAMYFVAFTYEFWAPYDPLTQHSGFVNTPPTSIRVVDEDDNLRRPFVYGLKFELNLDTFERVYTADPEEIHPIQFFVRGESYRFWGLFETDIHFIGVNEGKLFLLGTDELGRDLFSRILAASRISLTIGLVGVFLSFALGATLGGISGYYGGAVDIIIMRITEILSSIPQIPLWIALAAIVPINWPVIQTYFAITIILSILTWTGLARLVRAKLLELREQDYIMASRIAGASDLRVIFDHLLPAYISLLIVSLTLAIPNMILGETALSFLGLGIRAPAVSWGTLLQGAQNISNVALRPWMLTPALFVIVTVLLFNFIGDGLRDAADPYKDL
ncbi:MAG: ABC transporter permease [Anaerolineae bacterium]|nr:ABC transporter permease [Anaerolineae bacterium]